MTEGKAKSVRIIAVMTRPLPVSDFAKSYAMRLNNFHNRGEEYQFKCKFFSWRKSPSSRKMVRGTDVRDLSGHL